MGHGTEQSVQQLLTLARQGEVAALGQLLERHRSYLVVLARIQIGRRLQGKVDASDLVQDTFLEAHRNFEQFQGLKEETLLAWLRQILAGQLAHLVRRYCGTQARDVLLERTIEQELSHSSALLDCGLMDKQDSPSDVVSQREQALLLADALSRLPEDYRETIILRQLEGLSFADVAAKLGRSVDSVQKLWVRALDRLRREMT